MEFNLDKTWADSLRELELNPYKLGWELYGIVRDRIREACNGAFEIEEEEHGSRRNAIKPKQEMPWDYLVDVMIRSCKLFYIILPEHLRNRSDLIDIEQPFEDYEYSIPERMFALYDEKEKIIKVKAYTGNWIEEEDTSPGYDGFGRYDSFYESLNGKITLDGEWKGHIVQGWF